jgi:hypothetical protein
MDGGSGVWSECEGGMIRWFDSFLGGGGRQ